MVLPEWARQYGQPSSTLRDKPSYPNADHYGLFDALNTATGKLAWQIKVPNRVASGIAVAGDLVFWGQSNGKFNAVDAQSGQTLWTFSCADYAGPQQEAVRGSCNADGSSSDGTHAIGGANGAPAVYMANGREYVVMAFGGNTQVRSGQTSPPGDALIAFALPNQLNIVTTDLQPLSGSKASQDQNQAQQEQSQQNQSQDQAQQNQQSQSQDQTQQEQPAQQQNQAQQSQSQDQSQQSQQQSRQSGQASVAIEGYAYHSATVQVEVGTTVTWTNNDAVAHTVTSLNGSEMDSGNIGRRNVL
ncbi:MAG: PQQ-binding-like beta-propeller repeat protein [Caldilineaceae bacterium]